MRNFIYKIIIIAFAIILIFEFTVGKHIDNFKQQINIFATKEGERNSFINKERDKKS